MKQKPFSLRRRQVMVMSAGAAAAPLCPFSPLATAAPVNHSAAAGFDGEKIVVSGRVLGADSGQALAGAQIEIWQADARGVRAGHPPAMVTTDGDGRYFAALPVAGGKAQRLHYRVSHQGYNACVTQMRAHAQQLSVTRTRDADGATRAAFEMSLAPRGTFVSAVPDYVAL